MFNVTIYTYVIHNAARHSVFKYCLDQTELLQIFLITHQNLLITYTIAFSFTPEKSSYVRFLSYLVWAIINAQLRENLNKVIALKSRYIVTLLQGGETWFYVEFFFDISMLKEHFFTRRINEYWVFKQIFRQKKSATTY